MKRIIISLVLLTLIFGCATNMNLASCPAGVGEEILSGDTGSLGDTGSNGETITGGATGETTTVGGGEAEIELTAEEKELPKKEVKEGDLVEFANLKATDPDGDTLEYKFSSPLDAEGKWVTTVGDAGKYVVTITVSDGVNKVEQKVLVLVNVANHAPTMKLLKELDVNEGDEIVLKPETSDEDGDEVTLTYSGWQNKNVFLTTFDDAGEHTITVSASDGITTTEAQIVITVKNVNRLPTIEVL